MNNKLVFSIMASLFVLAAVLAMPGCSSGTPSNTKASSPSAIAPAARETQAATANVKLPDPRLTSNYSLEQAIQERRTVRSFADSPVSIQELSQLLWSGQGITDSSGKRAAPSAMALYPLEIYVIAGNVYGLTKGVYKYVPQGHQLAIVKEGETNAGIMPYKAPVYLVIASDMEKMIKRSGDNGKKFAYLEGGHAAQNICLESTALGLATVTAGGFQDGPIRSTLGIDGSLELLYVMPVGKKNT
jgi:SagB-type dehydrogenase family enzyme